MQFINDEIFHRDGSVTLLPPVEVRMNDTCPVAMLRIIFMAPVALPGYGTGIRVKQDFGTVKAESLLLVIRSVQPVSIFKFFNVETKYDHGIAESDAVIIRKWKNGKGLFRFPVEQ